MVVEGDNPMDVQDDDPISINANPPPKKYIIKPSTVPTDKGGGELNVRRKHVTN